MRLIGDEPVVLELLGRVQPHAVVVDVAIHVVRLHAITAARHGEVQPVQHDVADRRVGEVEPPLVLPLGQRVAECLPGEIIRIVAPVLPGPGREVANDDLAREAVELGIFDVEQIDVVHLDVVRVIDRFGELPLPRGSGRRLPRTARRHRIAGHVVGALTAHANLSLVAVRPVVAVPSAAGSEKQCQGCCDQGWPPPRITIVFGHQGRVFLVLKHDISFRAWAETTAVHFGNGSPRRRTA